MTVDVLAEIADAGVVPVVTIARAPDADPLAEALVAGGLPVVEITLRTDAGLSAIERIAASAQALVGAGTVFDSVQVDAAVDAGAQFVVSPGLDESVVERARARGVPVIPGVATASELMAAARLGLDVVKFFPAAPLGGPDAIRALASVMPSMRFVPTGGITAATAAQYLAVDAVLAVGGSWMIADGVIGEADWGSVRAAAASCRRLVDALR